jgi:hypothetical protein
VLRVREIASGQVNPGGRSTPRGRGGIEEFRFIGGGTGTPFDGIGGGWYPVGADWGTIS